MTLNQEAVVGNFVTLVRGNSYKGMLVGLPGPALLGLGSIVPGGGFRVGSYKTYGGDCPENIMLYPGDLYVSLKGATKDSDMIGSVARVPPEVASGRLTQDTVKLAMKFDADHLRGYLYWLLRTPHYRDYCAGHAMGSAVVALSRADFLSYPVPPLTPVRLTVVEVLEAVERKIILNRRMNKTLEAMARAIFKDWFVDFGPTRAKMEGRTAYLSAEIRSMFPDRLDNEGKPQGWQWGTLAQCATLNPESWALSRYPALIDYVDLAGTKWGTIETTEKHEREKAPSRAQRVLRPNDTIVGTVRPGNGSYAFVSNDGLTGSTGFAVLRPTQSDLREFVYLAATAPENIERLSHLADGAAYPAVRPEVVLATEVVVPPEALTKAFSAITGPLINRTESNKKESGTLAATRDLLLPKLMSGEIRVKDAEKIAEPAL